MKPIRDISDLTADPENARVHTPRGHAVLVESLTRLGAGRSIVVDEDGVVLAGNGTVAAARDAGITDVEVVDADPETLVAVRRTNLTPDDKALLAIADNRAQEFSHWDAERLKALEAAGIPVEQFFSAEELAAALAVDADAATAVVAKTKRVNKRSQVPTMLRFELTEIPLVEASAGRLKLELDDWIDRYGSSDGFGAVLVRRAEEAFRGR